ncbi:MAG: hypothetical protein IAE85_17135 [Anaerolinea sp.]|nr:hypothetical protein [Anaerolinea sp.]
MNRNKLMRRLGVVAALVGVLAIAAGAPVLQAQPEAGTISTGAGVQVWNGHSCPANVPVNIADLSAGLGGYETKVAWPAGRFNNTPANVGVTVSSYLAVNGRTNSSAGGTPLLKAVSGDTVKFGDYSWGAGNPAGNMANGQLATVALLPTATCGAAALTMSETQLVNTSGAVIGLDGQTGSSVSVFSRFDTSGGGALINSSDVTAVVAKLNQATGGTCGANYRYDTSLAGPLINSSDVTAVVAKLNQSTSVVCVN